MWKFLLVKNLVDKTYDITPLAGEFTWDTYLSLTQELDLTILYSDSPMFPTNPCDIGDAVIMTENDVEVSRFIIAKSSQQGRNAIQYTCYDWAWYLAQSNISYQFVEMPADQAIRRILTDFGMLIGTIPSMPALITRIYSLKTPTYIIDDILDQAESEGGASYSAEMNQGYISFVPTINRYISGTWEVAGVSGDLLANALDATRTRDLTQMRNRIEIIRSGTNTYAPEAVAEDTTNESRYGVLAEAFRIQKQDVAKSQQVAKILLFRLNRILENNTITVMGDSQFKAGYMVNIREPITGIIGIYLINHVKHTVSEQNHTMELELVLPWDVTEGVSSANE